MGKLILEFPEDVLGDVAIVLTIHALTFIHEVAEHVDLVRHAFRKGKDPANSLLIEERFFLVFQRLTDAIHNLAEMGKLVDFDGYELSLKGGKDLVHLRKHSIRSR